VPFTVGLTGGIGSGKSTVAELFRELGVDIIDTDEIARELTRSGGEAMSAIRASFGDRFLTADGALDRAAMRSLVFSDARAKARLEALLHPLIRTEATRRAAASTAAYVMLVVPLLVETGGYRDLAQRVLVVDCDESVQIARTMARDNAGQTQVKSILATQASREARLTQADDVVTNNAGIEALRPQVAVLHRRYLGFAQQH
jgi:dephospho-CoA kinase